MTDIALFAKELIEQKNKETQELIKTLKDEFGIEPSKEYHQPASNFKHFTSKSKKKKTKKYPHK